MQVTLVLMKQNGEVEVEYDKNLPDDSELAEIPDIGVAVVHVSDQHETVEGE